MFGLDPPEEQALTESGMRLFKSSNLDPEAEAVDLSELHGLVPSRQRHKYFLQVGGGSSFCVDDLDTGCGTDVEGLAYGLVFGRSVGGGVSLSLEYAGNLFTREAIKDFWKGGHHDVFGNVYFSLFQNLYTNLELFGGKGYSRYSANYRAKGGRWRQRTRLFLQ